MKDERVKVLYIAGLGRSGSTLLDRLIGQVEGFFCVGEIWQIWNMSFAENQLCGCGRPFRECDFWKEVTREAFGGFNNVDAERIKSLRDSVVRARYIPGFMSPLRTSRFEAGLKSYSEITAKLYRAIQKVSGASVIVDSSKQPPYGFFLGMIEEIDLRVVHLIRDSRAVAFSCRRKKHAPEIYWKNEFMPVYNPLYIALLWNANNFLAGRLRSSNGRRALLVRYEDLVKSPLEELGRITALTGETPKKELDFIRDGKVLLKGSHTVAGNPMRFEKGWIPLRRDDEWKRKMPLSHRLAVTTLTFPGLIRYGYL